MRPVVFEFKSEKSKSWRTCLFPNSFAEQVVPWASLHLWNSLVTPDARSIVYRT